jgi:hypothetical protein
VVKLPYKTIIGVVLNGFAKLKGSKTRFYSGGLSISWGYIDFFIFLEKKNVQKQKNPNNNLLRLGDDSMRLTVDQRIRRERGEGKKREM